MVEVTDNEKLALRLIFTDFLYRYNSHNLKDKIGLSNAGRLKLLRNLNKKGLLISEKIGNAIFYRPNLQNAYLLKLLELIFLDYSDVSSFVKVWIADLRPFDPMVKGVFLFGPILKKEKAARDVDVCFILKHPQDYPKLQATVNEMNKQNRLKIDPLYLTKKNFEEKLKERDKPLLEMVKHCLIVHGQALFVEVVKNAQS